MQNITNLDELIQPTWSDPSLFRAKLIQLFTSVNATMWLSLQLCWFVAYTRVIPSTRLGDLITLCALATSVIGVYVGIRRAKKDSRRMGLQCAMVSCLTFFYWTFQVLLRDIPL